jgi:RNA polymerase sigma-70 factor (ECF subfamily)
LEARATLPGVDLDPAEFAAYVAERGGDDDQLCEVDLWLAAACAKGHPTAIAMFDNRYMKTIGSALRTMNLSSDQIDDVAQELRSKLLVAEPGEPPRIVDYSGRADLGTWLRTAAVRTAIDMVRKRRDVPVDDDALAAAMPAIDDDPELLHVRERYQAELKEAFTTAINELEARDRALLKYHYIDGLGIDRIGALYGVHRATAARWIAVARDRLGKLVDRALRIKLNVSPSERASIARLVESHLDLSVRRILG